MLVCSLESLKTSAIFYVFHSQMPFTTENALWSQVPSAPLSTFPSCFPSCLQWFQRHNTATLDRRFISFQSLEWWGRMLLLLGYLSCQHRLQQPLYANHKATQAPSPSLFSHLDSCNSLLTASLLLKRMSVPISHLKYFTWDFPSDPVTKSSHSQCSGPGFNPWVREIDPACHK